MSISTKKPKKWPIYDRYDYVFNPQSNHYEHVFGDDRMPPELRIEDVRHLPKYMHFGVRETLNSRQSQGTKVFYTGLQNVGIGRRECFSGDWLNQGKKHLVAVAFSLRRRYLQVFVFRGYWRERAGLRLKLVREFLEAHEHLLCIQHLIKDKHYVMFRELLTSERAAQFNQWVIQNSRWIPCITDSAWKDDFDEWLAMNPESAPMPREAEKHALTA